MKKERLSEISDELQFNIKEKIERMGHFSNKKHPNFRLNLNDVRMGYDSGQCLKTYIRKLDFLPIKVNIGYIWMTAFYLSELMA